MRMDACVTLGTERETRLCPADLLRQMDEAGVDRAVIQPEDRMLAVYNEEGNRALLDAARAHPDRFIPACTANPWFGDRAVESLRRAAGEGARVAVFAPAVQGFLLGDEILDPLLETAGRETLVVYVHTGPHLHATPWQLALVAERHPRIPFLMGHSGATDFWRDVVPAASGCANVYIESSFARPFTVIHHLKALGPDRGVMGSGAPRNDLVFEWDQMRAVLSEEEGCRFYGETLLRLLENRPS
jgi:predicted TIM-barrel fold metal-dependent hydrolase